jgi:hypothetical protein
MTHFGPQYINLDPWRKRTPVTENPAPPQAPEQCQSSPAPATSPDTASDASSHSSANCQAQPGAVAADHQAQPEHWNQVVTSDYKIVQVADHQIRNLKERLRDQLGVPPHWARDDEKIAFHRRQLALLEKADAAPRCAHIYADGTRCRGPRMRSGKQCYAHEQMEASRTQKLRLPPLEDSNSVVLAVMEIQRALLDGLISEKTAGLLLYSLQIGACAVPHVTFRDTEPNEMVREQPALSSRPSATRRRRKRAPKKNTKRSSKIVKRFRGTR